MIYLKLVNGADFKVKRAMWAGIEQTMWVCRDAEKRIVMALDRQSVAAYSQVPPPGSEATELP